MACWLVKTEPDDYSFDDLVRDGRTRWDGIKNALALKHLRQMKKGDEVLIYHTGKQRALIGTATVLRAPHPDPEKDDPKLAVVDLKAGKALPAPVTLAAVKADRSFADFALVRMPRLSVMPVTAVQKRRLMTLART
ncbi:MAG: EVE domain-containing protein [Planctomycetota bacterium]